MHPHLIRLHSMSDKVGAQANIQYNSNESKNGPLGDEGLSEGVLLRISDRFQGKKESP